MSPKRPAPDDEFVACPCTGATLDKLLQPAVLAVLAEGPLHGYRIADRLGELRLAKGQRPDVSGVYRFLRGMEKKGLVESSWDVSERGPARRMYAITEAGSRCLRRWIGTLEEYQAAVADLLEVTRGAIRFRGGPKRRPRAARTRIL